MGAALSLLLLFITMSSTFRIVLWSFLGVDYEGVPIVDLVLLTLSLVSFLLLSRQIAKQSKAILAFLLAVRSRMNRANVFAFPFLVSVALGSFSALAVGGSVFPLFAWVMFDQREPLEKKPPIVYSYANFSFENQQPVNPRKISLLPRYSYGQGTLDNTWSFAVHFHRREDPLALQQVEMAVGAKVLPGVIAYNYLNGETKFFVGCESADFTQLVSDNYGFPTYWLERHCG